MTDKYSFFHQGKKYIARCFQPYRNGQPQLEYGYLRLFNEKGIKAPTPLFVSPSPNAPFIVYEMLEGRTLTDCFGLLNERDQRVLGREIAVNYTRISEIQNKQYGKIEGFDRFSDTSWTTFIMHAIEDAQKIAELQRDDEMAACCGRMKDYASRMPEPLPSLIWSDFSGDNIIVDENGRLSGFIDFEGLLSGDPTLGLGYLAAHEKNRKLVSTIMDAFQESYDRELIDFYSLIRWCRLLPYQDMPLPNGEERQSLRDFLEPACKLISIYRK